MISSAFFSPFSSFSASSARLIPLRIDDPRRGRRTGAEQRSQISPSFTWPTNNVPVTFPSVQQKSLKLSFVNDNVIQEISSVDSKMFHMLIISSYNIKIENVKIVAPGNSPNTNGIHIGESTNVTITDSSISTGDDCISIDPSTAGVTVSKVFCGPGHGISIGSLGKIDYDRDVTSVIVTNCTLTGTTNGVRIKSWKDSYALSASDFTFQDIIMNNVSNPIIIDQEYCPMGGYDGKISNIKFVNIRGTSFTNVAVNLKCSKVVPCKGVQLNNINLAYNVVNPLKAMTSCINVIGTSVGTILPPCI